VPTIRPRLAITTRLGCLPDVIALIDESLRALDQRLSATAPDEFINQGVSFMFPDMEPVRRLLAGCEAFLAASRSCFEAVARFYRDFPTISTTTSRYPLLTMQSPAPGLAGSPT
jgi:hypothetical protein